MVIFLAHISGCSGSSGSSTGADEKEDDLGYGALVINEIVVKDADGGNDWIELYVSGTE